MSPARPLSYEAEIKFRRAGLAMRIRLREHSQMFSRLRLARQSEAGDKPGLVDLDAVIAP